MEMISGIEFFLGFRKIGSDRWEFANDDFLQGRRSLLKKINRHKSSQVHQIGIPTISSGEMEKSELEGEFQNLRREKKLLMQEVVSLKQEHLMTVQQMDALNQRMQSAELRQKQMVSFLAKALQSPMLLARLKQQKEQRGITSRTRRKFLQQQHKQSNLDESMEQQILKYKLNLSDATSSSLQQSNKIVGKLGFHESGQETLGGSDEPGVRMVDSFFLDSDTAALDGKDLVNFQTDVCFGGTEYAMSFLDSEDIFQEELCLDPIVPASREEILNGGFEVGGSSFGSCHEVWDDLALYDAQGLEVATGPYTLWDLGDESSSQKHKSEAGVLNKDHQKDSEP